MKYKNLNEDIVIVCCMHYGVEVKAKEKKNDVQKRRQHAEYYHLIAKTRKLSAYQFAKSAKYAEKSEKLKIKAIKYTEKAVNLRKKTEPLKLKINVQERELKKLQGRGDVMHSTISKYEYKIAKLRRKLEELEAKAAKYTAKSAKFKEKSAKLLEKSKYHEKEGEALRDRADAMEIAEGGNGIWNQ